MSIMQLNKNKTVFPIQVHDNLTVNMINFVTTYIQHHFE